MLLNLPLRPKEKHPMKHRSTSFHLLARAVSCVALSLLSLLAVAHLINTISPYPLAKQIGSIEDYSSLLAAAQLRYIEEHKNDYDVLFFGSSRTYASLVPRRFDAEMAALGFPMRSFSSAMNGMLSHETDMTIKSVLATKPERLRWVVVEMSYWTGHVNPDRKFLAIPRLIFWHDLPNTMAAMRSTYLYYRPASRKNAVLLTHLLQFGMRATALGRGPQALSRLMEALGGSSPYPPWLIERIEKDQGYQEPGWKVPFSKPCGADANADQKKFYEKQTLNLTINNKNPGDISNFNVKAVKAQSARIRKAGMVPVYYIPPTIRATPDLFALKRHGIVEHLLAFNDPEAYPEVYKPENRVDCDHLATSGAELLTTAFARKFSSLLIKEGNMHPRASKPAPTPEPKALEMSQYSRKAIFSANPNPIQVCGEPALGLTKLSWRTKGPTAVEVRLGSPSGRLFARMGPQGQATTGKWLNNGTLIYLQDISNGKTLSAKNTLATVKITLTDDGCP